MARTRATNPTVSVARVKAFSRLRETPRASASSTPPNSGKPSERSAQLLLSLPSFIVAEIFALVLAGDLLFRTNETSLFEYVTLSLIVTQSKALRTVCRTWTQHLQDCLFAGLSARSGLLALVSLTGLPRIREIFPMLNHCVLDLGDMMDMKEVRRCFEELRSHPSALGIVRAVTWSDNSFQYLNRVRYRSTHSYRTQTRLLHEYLEHPFFVAVEGYLAKRSTGSNRLPPLALRDHLFSELMTMHYYHAHLLRNILSYIDSATYITIPAFIMPLLLGDWSYQLVENSNIQKRLDLIKNEGKPIRDILKGAQHVQFVGLPNPFVVYSRENDGSGPYETQRKMFLRTYHEIGQTVSFPTEFPWPARRIGFHEALELVDPDCRPEWWLRFLESAISSGRSPSVSIAVGSTNDYLPLGRPNLGLRPTMEYFTQPAHIHFCEEFPKLSLGGISRLDLNLLTICPMFFTNAKKFLSCISGAWNITSAPQLCSHWVETIPRPPGDQIVEDLAIIEQIMSDGHISNGNLDLRICFSYDTIKLPVGSSKTLELLPIEDRVIYKSLWTKRSRWSDENLFTIEFTTETFLSTVRNLYTRRKKDDFGLFNLLDELAGIEMERIKASILSYPSRS
ncbi:hypothetical protein FQN54_008530 [Arachnomyces sp. PD_36]|nr:hypothetical protein FQN54_008530 [Arachnomyces sp. PD_36]